MLIQGKKIEIKKSYYFFLFTILLGLGDGIATIIALINGHPPSVIIHVVHIGNNALICIAIFAPMLALGIMIKQEPSKVLSRVFWILMIIGVSLCLIVIVRGLTWLLLGKLGRRSDLKTFIYLREKKNEPFSPTTIYMSRTHKCCGIQSYSDWEEIFLEVDSARKEENELKNEKEVRFRKLPDFCCKKDPTKGCGTRYIKEMFDAMESIVSNCEDQDSHRNERCKIAEKNLLPHVEKKKIEDLPREVDITGGTFALVFITDPRIDASVDKRSLLEQPRVKEICNFTSDESFKTQVMVYYKGFAMSVNLTYDNNFTAIGFAPCLPQRVHADLERQKTEPTLKLPCEEKLIAKNYFVHAFGFCNWLNFLTNSNSRFNLEERIELAKRDDKVYYKGCQPHIEKYIDNFTITVVMCSSIILVLFCMLMHIYHRSYFVFMGPKLLECPMPRWYEPLPNEISQMHSLGDVDFIADGNCTKLPPLPCHLMEELELEDELGEELDP